MFELIVFLVLGILTAAVGWLFYDHRRLKASVDDIQTEDLVDRTELDSYHYRVVQLYQTHRDWSRGKFEEVEHRLTTSARETEPIENVSAVGQLKETEPVARDENSLEEPQEEASSHMVDVEQTLTPISDPTLESPPEIEPLSSAQEKVMEAWAAGSSIDAIAQDLRMGRQEVQLLIQVSRNRTARPVGA